MNLLIPYVYIYNHPDPLFEEYAYGDAGSRGRKLKKLKKGDYVFFHTSTRNRKYITAYYVVDRVIDTPEAVKDRNIMNKFNHPHLKEYLDSKEAKLENDCVLFGDPILSRILDKPLLFDKSLAEKLSLNINFSENRTETQTIGSATRSWRTLTDKDIKVLFKEIKKAEKSGEDFGTILSTDEVAEILEKKPRRFYSKKSQRFGKRPYF